MSLVLIVLDLFSSIIFFVYGNGCPRKVLLLKSYETEQNDANECCDWLRQTTRIENVLNEKAIHSKKILPQFGYSASILNFTNDLHGHSIISGSHERKKNFL